MKINPVQSWQNGQEKDITAVKYLDVHTILIAELQKEIKKLKAKLNN